MRKRMFTGYSRHVEDHDDLVVSFGGKIVPQGYGDIDRDLLRRPKPVTKEESPHGHDPFTIYGGPSTICNGTVYSDSLHSWYPEKIKTVGQDVFGSGPWFGSGMNGKKVEDFLRKLLDIPDLVLTRVIEMVDGRGYTLFRFDYHDPKVAEKEKQT